MGRGIANRYLTSLLFCGFAASAAVAAPPQYKFTDVTPQYLDGHLVRNASAVGMARNGLVCGQAYVDGLNRQVGWTYYQGQYKLIDNPSKKSIYIYGCNSRGDVVGERDSDAVNNPGSTPIASRNGVFVDLPNGNSYSGIATSINDDGIIVGGSYNEYNPDEPQYMRVWKDGQSLIGQAGMPAVGTVGTGWYIDTTTGTIAGAAPSANVVGKAKATYWQNGSPHQLGPEPSFPYLDSRLRGCNAKGAFVGLQYEYDPGSYDVPYADRAFVIDANGRRMLDRHGRRHSYANRISNSGLVTGTVFDRDILTYSNLEFGVFTPDNFYSIDSLLVNKPFGTWKARGIIFQDDGGENITGFYYDEKGMARAYVAEPVPEPASLVSIVAAMILYQVRIRRTK